MRGVQPNHQRIAALRRAGGLTQEQLALAADCDAKTVRAAERGQRVDLTTLAAIAGALAVPSSDLLVADPTDDSRHAECLRAVERNVAAFNARDPDAFALSFTPDGVNHVNAHPDVPGAGEQRGRGKGKGVRTHCY